MPESKTLNVAIVGAGFMGKAHSNAYMKVNKFFDLPAKVVMHTLTNRTAVVGRKMADRWGWQHYDDNPQRAIANPEIDLVDICVPNNQHAEIAFSFEQLNTLQYFDATRPKHVQGFAEILATEPVHPYAGAYWPPGHLIGYEHSFINQLADIVSCLSGQCDRRCQPDFTDGLACQKVVEAVERSSRAGRWVKLSAVK